MPDLFFHVDPGAPRTRTAKQIRYALTACGLRKAWDAAVAARSQDTQDWWSVSGLIPEDAPKLARLCGDVGLAPTALFDAAGAF